VAVLLLRDPLAVAASPVGSMPTAVPETTHVLPGLRTSVEVRRDRWGVPHIYAQNQHDLFFAQGYVAAQDRLFQMEMWRRQAEGRLSEVLGASAVNRDRAARLFAYRGDMAREWASYAADTRAIARAFVAGVNARIAAVGDDLPPEFGMLGFRPEPWTETVPLSRVTGLAGTGNANSEVLRAQLVTLLGAERAQLVLPPDPVRAFDPAPGLDLAGLTGASLGGFGSTFSDVAYNRLEGSNNWVVNASRTTTGKPILANDPHRVITNPAVRYLTHLVAPGWNVIGAGEPAAPGVAIGHNDRIAFGLTVVGMDQQDSYVEALGDCPGAGVGSLGCYRYRGAWRKMRVRRDTIRVRGEAPREVILQFTVHGPVVSVDTARRRAIAIRSVLAEPGTAPYLASLSLDRARNWGQFQSAMARWLMPSENMIYADVDGNIGWVAGGLMPRRHWSGMLPVPGDGSHEWSGFVSGMRLPRAYNPKAGYIATANHNILPAGYTTPIAYEWASRYRIDRVREVLDAPRPFTVGDFERLQHDDYSKLAAALVPQLKAAAARQGANGIAGEQRLSSWDFRMSREQVAPTWFAAWAPAVYRHAMARELRDVPEAARLLATRADYAWLESWLARSDVPQPARDSALVGALADAQKDLTARFGSDESTWRWGTIHVAAFRHPLSARHDLPAVSRSGDGNTVNATGGANFRQGSGASFREILDLADWDRSVVTNVPGQSADPRSPHYRDLLELWGSDRYFPLVYSRSRVEAETESVLWLRPAPRS
jgi:penicillin amidase